MSIFRSELQFQAEGIPVETIANPLDEICHCVCKAVKRQGSEVYDCSLQLRQVYGVALDAVEQQLAQQTDRAPARAEPQKHPRHIDNYKSVKLSEPAEPVAAAPMDEAPAAGMIDDGADVEPKAEPIEQVANNNDNGDVVMQEPEPLDAPEPLSRSDSDEEV